MDKSKLDDILQRHKAQPVGQGYIDIIVSRDNYKDFVSELIMNDYRIRSISWWEWCPKDKENEYGLGGPESKYFDGWFSEIPAEVDDLDYDTTFGNEVVTKYVIDKIENKTISFSDETVIFKESNWLTPAIWLDVPND
jgi:hypothetical protein